MLTQAVNSGNFIVSLLIRGSNGILLSSLNSKLSLVIISIVLFIATTGASYLVFGSLNQNSQPPVIVSPEGNAEPGTTTLNTKSKLDASLPKSEVCPLNGAKFTVQEKDVWSTRRPLAVMIENSVDARPQSGLGSADIVYEAVAEGGITRFMGMYLCDAALTDNLMFAPVRSARIYFVNLVAEYDALYNHVGGAGNCGDPNVDERAKALCLIDRAKIKNMDQMGYAGEFKTCHRISNRTNKEVAYEHTMACFADGLYAKAAKLNWTNVDDKKVAWDKNFVSWKFLSEGEKATGSPATKIAYYFWGSNRNFNQSFDVKWDFDPATDTYIRTNGGEVSVDLNTNKKLAYKTVIVQFAKETATGDLEKHMLYDIIGTGKALVFENGVAIDAVWSKSKLTSRTIFKDAKGKEIKLNPGPIWISIVPSVNQVEYN